MIPRGTAKSLRLALRAIRAARSHLKDARCGLKGEDDAAALHQLKSLAWREEDLLSLLTGKSKRRAA